jgi:plasmid stabilization system protein ParE
MRLRFTPLAVQDIAGIGNYLRARNPAAAQHVRAAIFGCLRNLILFPRAGHRQTTPGVRKIVTKKYAYVIYYTIHEIAEEIVILNVKHPAQESKHEDA